MRKKVGLLFVKDCKSRTTNLNKTGVVEKREKSVKNVYSNKFNDWDFLRLRRKSNQPSHLLFGSSRLLLSSPSNSPTSFGFSPITATVLYKPVPVLPAFNYWLVHTQLFFIIIHLKVIFN